MSGIEDQIEQNRMWLIIIQIVLYLVAKHYTSFYKGNDDSRNGYLYS